MQILIRLWKENESHALPSYLTSVMMIITGASLSKQHTDLLICHCTKLCHEQVDIYVSHKPTARTATVSVATYA